MTKQTYKQTHKCLNMYIEDGSLLNKFCYNFEDVRDISMILNWLRCLTNLIVFIEYVIFELKNTNSAKNKLETNILQIRRLINNE